MSKQIKLQDDVYESLKKEAERNYRSMSSHIDYLLSVDEAREIREYEAKAEDRYGDTPPAKNPEPKNFRSLTDIRADIARLTGEKVEKLAYCQDIDDSLVIAKKYDAMIQELWDEWNSMKAE